MQRHSRETHQIVARFLLGCGAGTGIASAVVAVRQQRGHIPRSRVVAAAAAVSIHSRAVTVESAGMQLHASRRRQRRQQRRGRGRSIVDRCCDGQAPAPLKRRRCGRRRRRRHRAGRVCGEDPLRRVFRSVVRGPCLRAATPLRAPAAAAAPAPAALGVTLPARRRSRWRASVAPASLRSHPLQLSSLPRLLGQRLVHAAHLAQRSRRIR